MHHDNKSYAILGTCDTNHFRLFSGRSTYHATKGSSAVFHFDVHYQSLSCRGVRVDGIDGLGESYLEEFGNRRPEDAIVPPRGKGNAYGSEDALKEALWNTLVGGRDLRGRKAPTDYRCLLKCSPKEEQESSMRNSRGRTAFSRLITQSAHFQIAGKTLSSFFPSASTSNIEGLRDPLEKIYRFVRTRRLMVTLNGSIGLVPIDAQRGDIVCLLLGCNVPLVLRAAENQHYNVVGNCYLHGIMDGEAMEWLKGAQSCIEEIILG